jgi:hypothetical protein
MEQLSSKSGEYGFSLPETSGRHIGRERAKNESEWADPFQHRSGLFRSGERTK